MFFTEEQDAKIKTKKRRLILQNRRIPCKCFKTQFQMINYFC